MGLGGYDVTTYFASGPIKGSEQHVIDHRGSKMCFVTDENKELFLKNPEGYMPQFDGQCSFALSLGKVETGNPKHWRVSEGKLFLNSNPVAGFLFKIIPGRVEAAKKNFGG